MTNEDVLKQVDIICGNKMPLGNGWYLFVYHNIHFVTILDAEQKTIRFSTPHLAKVDDFDKEMLFKVINETNRMVKFVKVIVLGNGSISLTYDHRIDKHDDANDVVEHMIKSLYYVAEYFRQQYCFIKEG